MTDARELIAQALARNFTGDESGWTVYLTAASAVLAKLTDAGIVLARYDGIRLISFVPLVSGDTA